MSNLLQTIETAITLYGDRPQDVREKTLAKLERYRHEKWTATLASNPNKIDKQSLLALELAVTHLATYPHEAAECLSKLLYYRYLAPNALDKSALMTRYYLEECTYYRRKKRSPKPFRTDSPLIRSVLKSLRAFVCYFNLIKR